MAFFIFKCKLFGSRLRGGAVGTTVQSAFVTWVCQIMPNFGYLVGNDSDKGLLLNVDEIAISGCTDIYLLRVRGPKDYTLMHFPPNFGRRKMSREYSDYDCLLNLVTDADANAKVLSTIKNSLVNYRGRLINKPTLVARTTRDLVSQACADIPEMITPKVLRFRGNISNNGLRAVLKNNDFQFPAILRKIGTHTGLSAIFIKCPEDIFHNISKKDSYYITEFFDYKSNDGLWRKYRVFVIGGNIIFRHLLIGEIWSVHAQNRKNYMAGKKPLLLGCEPILSC